MEIKHFSAEKDSRLDVFVSREAQLTRSRVQNLIDNGHVLVDGTARKSNYRLKGNEAVTLSIPDVKPVSIAAEKIPLHVIYEDSDLAVINKPAGMVVHPAAGNWSGTLVNALLGAMELSGINGELRPGIIHRLDKDTSGLLLIAKNDFAHQILSKRLQNREIHRIYWAIVKDNIVEDTLTVDAPIGRHPVRRKEMTVTADGRAAITDIRILERFGTHTLIEASLRSGRTHQIRVHMKYIRHPVEGDPVYSSGGNRQMLHARQLLFDHPRTGVPLNLTAPLPNDFEAALKKFRSRQNP
ncbi:MAG: RluA family pseudouridine synthase [Christensenellales bacterium]